MRFSSRVHIAAAHCGIVTVVGSFRARDLYTNADGALEVVSDRTRFSETKEGGRDVFELTLASDFARERSHVETCLDFARYEVGQTCNKTVDERREYGEVVRRLKGRGE